MTAKKRLDKLERAARVKIAAIPEDEFTFKLRVDAVNDLLGKYGTPPMTGEEFRALQAAVKAAGSLEAFMSQRGTL